MQPIRVWLSPPGPNPWKVITVLEELAVPYQVVSIRFEDMKKHPFADINGRIPAIEDPNTGVKIYETGAIILYLIQKYDTENQLHYDSLDKEVLCKQWLIFQVTGQGPYFGQRTWFTNLPPEKIPSAIERFSNEIKRVLGVLDKALGAEPNKEWLVGDRITYADLAFVPWNDLLDATLGVPADKKFEGFPNVKEWHERMTKRPSWIKAMALRARLMDEHGLDWNSMPKLMPKLVTDFEEYQESVAQDEGTEGTWESSTMFCDVGRPLLP
ncbi:unnamed protein product [Clonostachys byssicola]|uniref:glutathione transferase n=1 Tax=Clonostachys byssicola TaxID=160290 RepID=A0A9N9UCP4_9HYPO|nr:unnamed protein product [Clonostachys byssicola]